LVNLDKIIIVGDRLLIRPTKENEKSIGGLYLPPSVIEKEKVQSGYILKSGPGYPLGASTDEDEPWKEKSNIKYIPLQAREADLAFYLRKDAIEIEFENEKLVIIPQSSILMLYRDDEIVNL